MKPPPFEYVKARSVIECVDLLAETTGEAKILSGGQSLVPLMNLRLARPDLLIDVNALDEAAYERRDDDGVEIGALRRHVELVDSPMLRETCPLVADAASYIGYPAIRSRGTLGGSVAHADRAAELPCVCVALGADIILRSASGERTVPADEFFLGHFTTAIEPSEMLAAVRFPVRSPGEGWGFEEFARKTGDFAVAAVAAVLRVSGGSIEDARIAVSGVGDRPLRMPNSEWWLAGQPVSDGFLPSVKGAIEEEVAGALRDDPDGFQSHVAGVLAARAVAKAIQRGTGAEVR